MGTVLLAAVQGVICGVVTNGDPDEISWRQNLDALNFMMSDTNLPQTTRLAVRRFFRKSKRLFKRKSFQPLVDNCLSIELQRSVRYQIASEVFQGIWWLNACQRDFLEDLSVRVLRVAFGPGDPIYAHDALNVLTHGMASRGGIFLAAGDFFGDIILTSPVLRDTTQAKALCYCEIARITREDLFHVLKGYPESQRVIRMAGLKVAMKRAITIIAIYANIAKQHRTLNTPRGRDTPSEVESPELRAALAAQRSITSLTGDHKKTPDPTAMLHSTFGDIMGGWREIGHDKKGRDVILEPGTSSGSRSVDGSPHSSDGSPIHMRPSDERHGRASHAGSGGDFLQLRHEMTSKFDAMDQKLNSRIDEMTDMLRAVLQSGASPAKRATAAAKAAKAAKKASAIPPPLPGSGGAARSVLERAVRAP